MLRLLIAASVLVVVMPTPADACINGVERRVDDEVQQMVKIEMLLDKGLYRKVREELEGRSFRRQALADRAEDVRALLAIRVRLAKDDVAWVVSHFEARAAANKKDMRFKAWTAEAYAATGKIEQALAILVDLKKRDLMPDAFAYLTLAKLSSGAERETALKDCRTRATSKSVCTIPEATAKS